VTHLALPVALYFMTTGNNPAAFDNLHFDVMDMVSTDPFGAPIYLVAASLFIVANLLPRSLVRQARAKRNLAADETTPVEHLLLPYLVRICLLETVSILGLALAIMSDKPFAMIPLLATGLIATLRMAPTEEFLHRFGYVPD
jgi:hypothetical protein